MFNLIGRYIFREITFPFFIILFVLTFVLLTGRIFQIADLIVNKGISFWSILNLIAHLLPNFFLFTLPIALLTSILIGMGRLSTDNEITALKASGVGLLQLFRPVVLLTAITFVLTFLIGFFLVPQSNFSTKKLLFELAQQNVTVGIKEKTFNSTFTRLVFYADKIPQSGEYMENVLVADRRLLGEPSTVIARKAYLVADTKSMIVKLRFLDGSIHTVSPDLKNYRRIDFKNYDIQLDLSYALILISDEAKSSSEMTFTELIEKRKNPKLSPSVVRELSIEAHKKFSMPLSCIFFALLAFPLGIRSHRAVKSRGFGLGLLIASAYYLLRIGGEAFVETGHLPLLVGVWLPNLLFFLIGVVFLISTHYERPVSEIIRFRPLVKRSQVK